MNIETKTARQKLPPAGKPYFRPIAPGLALGYRRTVTGAGRWVVRRADGSGGNTLETLKTRERRPVVADDIDAADGVGVMNFAQAQTAAGGPARVVTGFTVADAIDHYLKVRKDQGRETGIAGSLSKAKTWILPQLGGIQCNDLTRERIREWLAGMAAKKMNSTRESDPEKLARSRRATANRVLTTLKAALNVCYLEKVNGRQVITSDEAWRRLSPLPDADSDRERWLTVAEAQRLVRVCDNDFKILVQAALTTGARYGQLASMKVKQFDADSATLTLETHKGTAGRTHKYRVYLNAEAVEFFKGLCAGRKPDDWILTTKGERWEDSEQTLLMNAAVDAAKIEPRIVFHGLRHTYASLSLQATPPMSLLILSRNLGHTTTKRVEKTYGHLAAQHIRDAVNASAPSFGFVADAKVVALR